MPASFRLGVRTENHTKFTKRIYVSLRCVCRLLVTACTVIVTEAGVTLFQKT